MYKIISQSALRDSFVDRLAELRVVVISPKTKEQVDYSKIPPEVKARILSALQLEVVKREIGGLPKPIELIMIRSELPKTETWRKLSVPLDVYLSGSTLAVFVGDLFKGAAARATPVRQKYSEQLTTNRCQMGRFEDTWTRIYRTPDALVDDPGSETLMAQVMALLEDTFVQLAISQIPQTNLMTIVPIPSQAVAQNWISTEVQNGRSVKQISEDITMVGGNIILMVPKEVVFVDDAESEPDQFRRLVEQLANAFRN